MFNAKCLNFAQMLLDRTVYFISLSGVSVIAPYFYNFFFMLYNY